MFSDSIDDGLVIKANVGLQKQNVVKCCMSDYSDFEADVLSEKERFAETFDDSDEARLVMYTSDEDPEVHTTVGHFEKRKKLHNKKVDRKIRLLIEHKDLPKDLVRAEKIKNVVRSHVNDGCKRMLRWKKGHFCFVAKRSTRVNLDWLSEWKKRCEERVKNKNDWDFETYVHCVFFKYEFLADYSPDYSCHFWDTDDH